MQTIAHLAELVGIAALLVAVLALRKKAKETMTALQKLTDSIADLSSATTELATSVDAAVVELQAEDATEAQLNTLAASAVTLAATIRSQSTRLADAVNPPPPPTEAGA